MIAQLTGKVVEVDDQNVILDVGGVGYGLKVPASLALELKIGQPAKIVTYHYVKENINELYGFGEAESKKLFELLIGVSGVGPKSALAVMSLGPQAKIRQAVIDQDSLFLASATGVGKRSAERICVELKDKLAADHMPSATVKTDNDALAALVSLGYSHQQSVQALSKVDQALTGPEQLKQALRNLS